MGWRLVGYFKQAEEIGGISGKVQLASITRVTSTEAESIEDTPELRTRFESALAVVRARFVAVSTPAAANDVPAEGGSDAEMLRRHIRSYLELMSQREVVLGQVEQAYRRVNEAAANTLEVARVSVWLLDDAGSKITSVDLFERSTARHSSGTELFQRDYPAYFEALKSERTIAAHDAHTDPRTNCFSESYLAPLGIGAMLDVPIWVRDRMIGVICHEHVGGRRAWNADEETFAYLMSNFLALAVERKG
jgi:uncharacterized membrane protein